MALVGFVATMLSDLESLNFAYIILATLGFTIVYVVKNAVWPSISVVGIDLRDGVVAVLAVAQKISFVADIGTTNYRLLLNITDASGVPVAYTLGALETDGFNITPSFPGTLWYNAKVITI